MQSFRITATPHRRAAARFVSKVRGKLLRALEDERPHGVTQSKIADALGVHRSVVSRELHGRQNISMGRAAELAWAMGYEADFQLHKPVLPAGANEGALGFKLKVENTSGRGVDVAPREPLKVEIKR